MPRITKKQENKIETIREKKSRTTERVYAILKTICDDNKEIFKKDPEKRVKSLDGIIENFKSSKEKDWNKTEKVVRDIAGTRVTCCTMDEIIRAQSLIRNHPDILGCKVLKNYTEPPDDEGYRGHHLEVKVKVSFKNHTIEDFCEVQIRTLASDLWAILSHRDFYKTGVKIPDSVRTDMKTLSKQLEIVDSFALSLKNRIRDEVDKEAEAKSKDKSDMKDMLTHDNISKLIKTTFKRDISVNLAYRIIQFALTANITSLKKYKELLKSKESRNFIEAPFKKLGIKPSLEDYLMGTISINVYGESYTKRLLETQAKNTYNATVISVEKGRSVSKEELQKKSKTSYVINTKKKR